MTPAVSGAATTSACPPDTAWAARSPSSSPPATWARRRRPPPSRAPRDRPPPTAEPPWRRQQPPLTLNCPVMRCRRTARRQWRLGGRGRCIARTGSVLSDLAERGRTEDLDAAVLDGRSLHAAHVHR